MKAKGVSVLAAVLLLSSASFAQVGTVVQSFPSPGSKPSGLTWDGHSLWNADLEEDRLYQIDPQSGQIIHSIPAPGGTPTGLAWDGQYLWCADNTSGQERLYRLKPSDGGVVSSFPSPGPSPRGITFAEGYLWCQDSGRRHIYKLDPSSGAVLDTLPTPYAYARGLTWDGRYLWSTDRHKAEIYLIDPERKKVIFLIPAPGTYSYGLAWDGEFLWHADYETRRIYKIRVSDTLSFTLYEPLQVHIRYVDRVTPQGPSTITLTTNLAVPPNTIRQRLDSEIVYSPGGFSFVEDQYGQRIARYTRTVGVGETSETRWEADVTLWNLRYTIFPDSVGDEIPDSIRWYTRDESKYNIYHPLIQSTVREVIGEETSYYWKVRRLHDFVIERIQYKLEGGWDDAPTVLARGNGSCSEYSFLFIALCRAAFIPARYMGGSHMRRSVPYTDSVFHRWTQVYFPNYGWIPIDPTWNDRIYPANQVRYFGAMKSGQLTTTIGGGNSAYLRWNYNCRDTWSPGGQRVEIDRVAYWEPYGVSVKPLLSESPFPDRYQLLPNFPNPFGAPGSRTTIRYVLSGGCFVEVAIFNALGQVVAILDRGYKPAGFHEVTWDGRDQRGHRVPSGVYFYRLTTPEKRVTKRLTVLW